MQRGHGQKAKVEGGGGGEAAGGGVRTPTAAEGERERGTNDSVPSMNEPGAGGGVRARFFETLARYDFKGLNTGQKIVSSPKTCIISSSVSLWR